MPLQIQGNGGTVLEVAGTGFRGAIVHAKPVEFGAFGHYQVSLLSGVIAAGIGANSEILQIRWTDATRLCIPQKLTVTGMRATTAFAVGVIDLTSMIARAFTAPGTGGTTATLTGNNQKLRTSMGTSLMGEIRVVTTAALGAGTKVLDAHEIDRITTHSSAGTSGATPIIGSIYLPKYDLFEQDAADGEHPIVFAQNEGLVVRCTVPATGVWNIGFTFKWAEVSVY